MNENLRTKLTAGLFALSFLVTAMLMLCVPRAWAATGLSTGQIGGLSAQSAYGMNPGSYAIVKSDGYLHITDASHSCDGGTLWGDSYRNAESALDNVSVLYVDSDVTTFDDIKITYAYGKSSTYATIKFHGDWGHPGPHNLSTVEFLLDASGRNSCSRMSDWYMFNKQANLIAVKNFDKTRMTTVPNGCFFGCSQLSSIAIPQNATSIGASAFYDCDSLTSINVPASVTAIGTLSHGDGSFANCDGLRKVVLNANTRANVDSGTFRNTSDALKVYVPNSVLAKYKDSANSNPWNRNDMASRVHGFLEIASVGKGTYSGKALKPAVSVTWQGAKLAAGNYAVSYANNVKAGSGKVTVTAKSPYFGTTARTFSIAKASIGKASFSKVKAQKLKKKGKAVTPKVTVKFAGKKLKKGTDYTVKYSNNKKKGTATIKITGKGNFKGTKTIKFKIK